MIGKYGRYWNNLWKSWALKTNSLLCSAKSLWIFYRHNWVQALPLCVWARELLSSGGDCSNLGGGHCLVWLTSTKMWKKTKYCPWKDKPECGLAVAVSETNFHGKNPSIEIEVHNRKQMEVISDLAREQRQVTTVSVNLFIEIHWLDGIAKGMHVVQTSGYFFHYN